MTSTLFGRIQTRVFAVFTAGLVWTLLITPFLPSGPTPAGSSRLGNLYRFSLTSLVLVGLLGVVVWEPLYHLLQQFRWEKDWPAMFVLLEGIPEGALVHAVATRAVTTTTALGWPAFLLHFATTWIVIFVFIHGPMRVPFLRWRFRGGRLF